MNFCIPKFNDLLSTAIKGTAKENFRKATLFYIPQKILIKLHIFSRPIAVHHFSILNEMVLIVPISPIRASSMSLLLKRSAYVRAQIR
jgi:hypothetical protein